MGMGRSQTSSEGERLTKRGCTGPATTGQAMLQLFPAFERAGATFANGERLGKGR